MPELGNWRMSNDDNRDRPGRGLPTGLRLRLQPSGQERRLYEVRVADVLIGGGGDHATYEGKGIDVMSKSEVSAPVSSAASDRLILGVGWVRPEFAGIGGTLRPASGPGNYDPNYFTCFESSEA